MEYIFDICIDFSVAPARAVAILRSEPASVVIDNIDFIHLTQNYTITYTFELILYQSLSFVLKICLILEGSVMSIDMVSACHNCT